MALAEAMSQVRWSTQRTTRSEMFDGLMQLVLLNQPSDQSVRSRRSASLSLMLCLPPRMFLCTALQSRLQRRSTPSASMRAKGWGCGTVGRV